MIVQRLLLSFMLLQYFISDALSASIGSESTISDNIDQQEGNYPKSSPKPVAVVKMIHDKEMENNNLDEIPSKKKSTKSINVHLRELTKVHGKSMRNSDILLADIRQRARKGLISDLEKERINRIKKVSKIYDQNRPRNKIISEARKAVRYGIATKDQKALVEKMRERDRAYDKTRRVKECSNNKNSNEKNVNENCTATQSSN